MIYAYEIEVFKITACERSVSEAENGAKPAENRVERSGGSGEREVAERERSGERAGSATHSPLRPNI